MDYFFIGDAELVTAFRFIGIDGAAARDSAEASSIFRRITEGWVEAAGAALPDSALGASGCRVLLITEEVAGWLGDLLIEWQVEGRYPLIVKFPALWGGFPAGRPWWIRFGKRLVYMCRGFLTTDHTDKK